MNAAQRSDIGDSDIGGSDIGDSDVGSGAVGGNGTANRGAAERGPNLLADLDWCLAQAAEGQRGALWRLAEPGRQLDANLVRLPPDATVEAHTERDVDVLLLPIAGHGTLYTDGDPIALATHALTWVPRGSRRSVTAGPGGLAYLTVHRARTGMRIQLPTDPEALARLEAREEAASDEGGEAACLLPRLCPHCAAVGTGGRGAVCEACGEPWD